MAPGWGLGPGLRSAGRNATGGSKGHGIGSMLMKTARQAQAPGANAGLAKGQVALPLLVAGTFFMENLDATVITPALPAMATSFGVAPIDLNIGVSAYMLTLGVFIPVSGWVAERYGARAVFASAIALFTLASLFCGLTSSLPAFVAARVLQGIGGAMMVPVGRLVVLRETPKDRLVAVIAMLTWPGLIAPVLGPVLGGLIVSHASWRWLFYLNLPLGALALLVAVVIVPAAAGDRTRVFDWPGFLLTGAALFCLMLGAELLSGQGDWTLAVGVFAGGIALLFAGVRHLRRASQPMITLDSLQIGSFALAIWGGSLFRMGISAVPFLLPLMLQLGLGFSPFEAGLMLMAVFAGNLAMKPMTTWVLRRYGFRRVLIVNGLINAVTIAGIAIPQPFWLLCVGLFIGGMSRSMQFTAINTLAFADVPQPQMTNANTLFSAAFQLSIGLGVALGATAWRIGEALSRTVEGTLPFRIAFLLIALTSLIAVAGSLRLPREAGLETVLPLVNKRGRDA